MGGAYRLVIGAMILAIVGQGCGDAERGATKDVRALSESAAARELHAAVKATLAAPTLRVHWCTETSDYPKSCAITDFRAPDRARLSDGEAVYIENVSYDPAFDAPESMPADGPMRDDPSTKPNGRYTRNILGFGGPSVAQVALGLLPGLGRDAPEKEVRREGGRYIVTSTVWRPNHDTDEITFDRETSTVEVETERGYVTTISTQNDDFAQTWKFSRFGEDVPSITPPPDDLIDEDVEVSGLCDDDDSSADEIDLNADSPPVMFCTPRGDEDLPEPKGPTESTMQFRALGGRDSDCPRADSNPPQGESAVLADANGLCYHVGPALLAVQRAEFQVSLDSPTTATLRTILQPKDRDQLGAVAKANKGREVGVVMFGVILTTGTMYDSDYGGEVFIATDLPLASRIHAALAG